MRAYKALAAIALCLLPFAAARAQVCDLKTDADAYITREFVTGFEDFVWIDNGDEHPVRVSWAFLPPWVKWLQVWRSYIHFDKDGLPDCIKGAYLNLHFSRPRPPGVAVEVHAVEWDGASTFTWSTQPPSYWSTSFSVTSAGWYEVDVTEPVRQVLSGLRSELAFMVRLEDEVPGPVSWGRRSAPFDGPCLRLDPCVIEVRVWGLEDFTVGQEFLSGNRYAPLDYLWVKVYADMPYRMYVCYDVNPSPTPPFTDDPVDLAYTWVWMTLPRCPSYIPLPGFSGTPGDETHSYRVRVDLADLGDRSTGESFTFTIRVWAVPQ